ncbi:MAG TPA: serine/threonine-protein kinase [Burkholderiaceae bacterium]|nr:serine/threonine-protein kinase [Burkholderiaceae bacterium]
MPTLELPLEQRSNALPVGTRLGEFEVRAVVGVGGFGIVYRAFDHALEREVAIKEYMPGALAARSATLQVSVLSQGHAESFVAGLHSFVNEARLLARFDHPSLVKVHRYWEANGTAYMAMPFYEGRTLKALRKAQAASPNEHVLTGLLEPLLAALETLHKAGVVHRDVSPDNILVVDGGTPVLLDFGAARRAIGDQTQALTAILKPNFAPVEQYGETEGLRQGPWTDLYALGATLYFLVTGTPPPPATARALGSGAESLADTRRPGLSMDFLRTIDWMMAPRPEHRPQSVAALREVLAGRSAAPIVSAPMPLESNTSWEHTRARDPGRNPRGPGMRPDVAALWRATTGGEDDPRRPRGGASPSERWRRQARRAARRRRVALLLAMLGLVGAGAAAWVFAPWETWLPGHPTQAQAPTPAVAAAPAPRTDPAASAPAALASVAEAASSAAAPTVAEPTAADAAASAPAATAVAAAASVAAAEPAAPTLTRPVATPSPASLAKPARLAGPVKPVRMPRDEPPPDAAAVAIAREAAQSPSAAANDAVQEPAAAGASPREQCQGRMLVALHRCLTRACEAPAWSHTRECRRVRQIEAAAQRAEN